MIDIMTDSVGYSNSSEMDYVAQLNQQVFSNWSTAIVAKSEYPMDEQLQLQTCIKLAIRCVDSKRDKRPSVADILIALNKTETNIPKRQLADKLPYQKVGPSSTERDTLEKMIAELENIANEDKHYNSTPRDNNLQQATETRETTSNVNEELIIGRSEEKKNIMHILSGRITPETTVLPIYGIGGIGKTTLARLVFNDSQFADHSQVWVYVSETLDLHKIGNSVISQLSEEKESAVMQIIQNRLSKLLAGKKILIVLDDVWEKNPDKLEALIDMLSLGVDSMVKIIATTRDEAIAKEICHNVEPYKLEPFSDRICWKIIKQKSDFKHRVDKKQLKYIGREIATKCGGVALAAQSLGCILRMKHSDEWESVRDSYIWNLSTSQGSSSGNHKVLASLLLSYTHMPDWLKLCFFYCAVFSKGHHIPKYDLIHQWIALGFTEQSSPFDPMQLCEGYVTQLLEMSFLEYSKTRPSIDGRLDKDVILFTMHDLVHDLARAILAHQVNDKGNAGGDRCRYALLTDCSNPLQLSVKSPANIKALHFLDCGKSELCGAAFSQAICLHILDLSGCSIQELPVSIGQLKQLRFLHAPRIENQIIPDCITQLSELHYLNLRGSRYISALPESIGDMKGLMHLDLSGCRGISELPISFTELKQLAHLDLSHCHVPVSEAFGGFTKLQYLNLSVEDMYRMRGPLEFIGSLKKLRYLNLAGCIYGMELTQDQIRSLLDSISTLSNLEHLDLSYNYPHLRIIPESFGNLRKLHTLNLSGCYGLEKLPDSMVNMVSLKVLELYKSAKLDASVLSLLNIAPLPHFVVRASIDKCCSNIICLQPTNPVEMMIDELENVMFAEEAWSIKLREKQNIKKLTFQWTVDAERFVDDKEVLEKLVPPSSVQSLYISGYRNVILPDWLVRTSQHLPNLSCLVLSFFRNFKNLPSLGQLPNLRELSLSNMDSLEEWNSAYASGEEGANELFFPKLERLSIVQCPKLRRLLVGQYSVFPKLESLYISHCAKLRIEPCMPRAEFLWASGCHNVLSSWGQSSSHNGGFSSSPIPLRGSKRKSWGESLSEDCDVLLSSWGESSSDSGALSSSPITLRVEDSKVPLHQRRLLHHLPALRNLMIHDCSDLTISPDIIKKLFSLQLLSLENQQEAELPRWVVSLTSLQRLILTACKNMTSLPNSIQQLTNLKCLHIEDCPALKEWCESEENKMKLAHIRVKCFWD